MRRTLIIFTLLLAAATAPVQAAEPGMRVDGAWSRRAPMINSADAKAGTGNGVVYATLANPGKEPDTLVAAASDAAGTVEIHESYRDMGMIMMRPVAKVVIPAGGKVEMKPGGYHVMLINLKRDLKPGEVVELTLQFEKAGKVAVKAPIK